MWSSEMNRDLRKKIKDNHPEATNLKYVFVYWVILSELLELHYEGRWWKGGQRKGLIKEAETVEAIIMGKEKKLRTSIDTTEGIEAFMRSFLASRT